MLEKFYLNNLNSFHPSLVVMFPKPFLIHTDVLQNASNGLMVLFSSSFMTETWCITSAYQNSWTGRLFYVPYRLFVQFVNFFLFFFWNRMTCLTHMWFIPFFSKELPPSPSFILVYLHCDIFCFSIFCLSLLTASYFPIIFFNSTKYFCRTMTSQLYQYLLLLRVFYLPILPWCDILYRA